MDFKKYLRILVKNDGSDLYLTFNAPPSAKFNGELKALSRERMTSEQLHEIAEFLMNKEQLDQFEHKPEMNLALDEPDIGRFRINIFKQRTNLAMVIRNIKVEIPNADDLGLPQVLKEQIMKKRGLILFVGGTGSGKSTSLAALIDHRNSNSAGHIVTIEDPIEYVHPHKKSLVSQREVGVDTDTYEDALENTLRQAPDVILIGEIRTEETMEHALAFAETGHLCLSTLHANNANQALDRIINFFPEERHSQLLMDIGLNIQAFISQRLIPTVDGKRVAAIEILIGTQTIRDLIMKGDVSAIKEIMEKSEELGMQTFDSHIYKLHKQGIISLEEALKNADSPSNLQVKLNLEDSTYSNMTSDEDTTEEEQAAIDLAFGDLALEEMDDGKPKLDEENKILKTPQELMEEKIARRLQEDARNAEELKKMEEILQKNM
uniref:PilT/PilU family type 4a pilus ATPase n=1 Tax=unclassified Cocleimonas TaxID=2639732 RepID=UPI002DBB7E27|nr:MULTISPECIES: PilT/PilU family type 4a pilus ATPase [unclassified Cocleimonas]MEB8432902.1 PilT/PilU family type 4a pilus ATPase [Cocleimonas sp. KMM 6892]MEC4716117.1 PilT/PilU family type 4a pilus ATPase [Cocleimonas sp. KMM 6895]MEC4745578.1 PilT/PilU family type 4a pilus ATPase [Cocleimonas sp. KMM 6896]